jgi:hypothetical protein
MRGGSIPILAWGVLLSILTIGNAIWEGRWLQAGQFAFAAIVIFAFALFVFALSGRRALHKGPPEVTREHTAVPEASVGAVVAALSLAMLLFGFVFGSSLIYMGAGFLALSLGRLALEVRSERQTVRRSQQEQERQP